MTAAIHEYAFPVEYFDFAAGEGAKAPGDNPRARMTWLETHIHGQLHSADPHEVLKGLANIVWWGNAGLGYRQHRFDDFRHRATADKAMKFMGLLAAGPVTLAGLKGLKLPVLSSGVSFASKVLMFLEPAHYGVLDLQLEKLRTPGGPRPLDGLGYRRGAPGRKPETQIRISRHNEEVYDRFRRFLLDVSATYYHGTLRAADIERGFFQLIRAGHLLNAQAIYTAA